jgi:hypothetical protein
MPTSNELPSAIHQGSSWKMPVLFGFVVFALTVLALQLREQIRTQSQSVKAELTTAIIGQCPPIFEKGINNKANASSMGQSLSRAIACPKSLQIIQQQITSPDLLRQAWLEIGWQATDSEVEKLRRAISVNLEESPMGEKCLRLALPWNNSQTAAKILKALGERYAASYQAAWKNENQRKCSEAKTTSDRAGQAFDDAVGQLELFQESLAWQAMATPIDLAVPTRKENSPLSTLHSPPDNVGQPLRDQSDVENPDWLDLQKEIVKMQNKEAKLLETRTPLHPEVAEIHDQIHEREMQLTALPRWIHKETSSRPLEEGPMVRTESPVVSSNSKPIASDNNPSLNQKALSEAELTNIITLLENHVQSTAQAYLESLTRKQAAIEQQKIAPEITVQVIPFRQTAIVSTTTAKQPFAWLAGIVMAVGVGLICTGKSIEPPIGSVKELQRLAAVPIIGVIPSDNPTDNPRATKRNKCFLRLALYLSGLAFIGFCVWAIVRLM